jgi:hypothetical protein
VRLIQQTKRALTAAALSFAAAGCAPPPAHVAQGTPYTTGNTAFDDFFTAVREVRAQAVEARADEEASHAGLIKALGLEAKSTSALAIDEAGLRAKKLHDGGVLLHLEITPEPKVVAQKGKAELGPDGDALLKSIEDAARSSLEMRKRLAAVAGRAAELGKRRIDLRAQAPATFRGEPQAKRDDVIFELDAAEAVLTTAAESANHYAGAASRFVVELAQAVETGAAAVETPPSKLARGGRKPPPSPAVAAASPAPKPAAAQPPKAAPPPGPAAAPPPRKKTKSSDDFEP